MAYFLMACKKNETREIERIASQQKQSMLDKIKKGEQLSGSEIGSLAAILSMEGNFDQGINTLQQLERTQSYKDVQYEVHFALAVLNKEKAMSRKQESNRELITAFETNLNKGFTETPDRALAFYKRGNVYSGVGCITKAKQDLEQAITLAGSGDLIFWGDGIYLNKDQFIQIVKKQLDPLGTIKDHCILEESKPDKK
jgi:tetratricopeptide (TPR) repeat protein